MSRVLGRATAVRPWSGGYRHTAHRGNIPRWLTRNPCVLRKTMPKLRAEESRGSLCVFRSRGRSGGTVTQEAGTAWAQPRSWQRGPERRGDGKRLHVAGKGPAGGGGDH